MSSLAEEVIELLTLDGPVEVDPELLTDDGWPITMDYDQDDPEEDDSDD